ncbi:hypothetical protein HDV03_000138 [Kappamyces sp. JEL0829]|nr:hypothetical protein HDV03_000138 [Kappamyces sp. JEL0829]
MKRLKVHLYKNYFTLGQSEQPIPYNGPFGAFIDALNTLEMNGDVMSSLSANFYKNGVARVEVVDHRFQPVQAAPLVLFPSASAVHEDIQAFGMDYFGSEWSPNEMGLELEEKVLPSLYPTLDLEVQPRSDVGIDRFVDSNELFKRKTLEAYNQQKYIVPKKRRANPQIDQVLQKDAKRNEDMRSLILMEKAKDSTFFPAYSQLSFIEDWKKKKKMADEEAMIGLGDKQKIKLTSSGIVAPRKILSYNMNKKICRTLKFESEVDGKSIYSVFNVYELSEGQFEGVLRWGNQEGTAINGGTIRYPLGNKQAVDYYVAHFRGFYGIMHKITFDTAATTPVTNQSQ